MRRARTHPTTNRPWRRRNSNASADPAAVFRELQRRKLSDLEDCRLAWEHGGDPLAVCAAVTKCDLPEWLADALLVILTDEAERGPEVIRLRRRWAKQQRDSLDALRAQTAALARTLNPESAAPARTWESAHILAEALVRRDYKAVEKVGPEAIKKSYRLVCRRLAEDPGRYYFALGFQDRLRRARQSFLRIMEADLARQRDRAGE
jgi:hypothetical protein